MGEPLRRRGSSAQRSFVWFLSFVLTLLVMWLLNFVVSDIGNIRGPVISEIEDRYLDQAVEDQRAELREQMLVFQRDRSEREADIEGLRQSMDNALRVFNELITLPDKTDAQRRALDENQAIFFARPREIETANAQIRGIDGNLRSLQEEIRTLDAQRTEQLEPAREEFQQLLRSHRFKVATLKLLFLMPVLLIAAWLVIKKRESVLAPLIYALFVAAFFRVALVAWEYFPARFFKYIALATTITVVIALIVKLIRMVIAPKPDVLLNQNRESYNQRRCPICAYPIRRGQLRNVVWTRKGPQYSAAIVSSGESETDDPYRCPSCGEPVFEKCSKCGSTRHSLLPYCESCGDEHPIGSALIEASPKGA
ncbi:MAG: hypothetical protein IIB90_03730 [Gemmatimonadetes bacterium]|nr:hypothetical protein [Gemmatimonadota bacterium]